MHIHIDINIALPDGWNFVGVWVDNYEKDASKAWAANAELRSSERHTMLSVEAIGSSAQEALERLPGEIARALDAVIDQRAQLLMEGD